MEFDGVRSYIDAGNAPSLQLQSNFTIAAWIWPEPSDRAQAIITKSRGHPQQAIRALEFTVANSDELGAYFWNESSQYMSGTAKSGLIPRREWTHIVLQHDIAQTRQMVFYINGVKQQVSFTYETVNSVPVIRQLQEPIRIGCFRPNFYHYAGLIDEIMIFDRVLKADEIQQLVESGL